MIDIFRNIVNSRYHELRGTRREGSLYREFVIPRVGTIRKTLFRGFVASSLYREVRYTEGTLYRELTFELLSNGALTLKQVLEFVLIGPAIFI